MPGKFSGAPVDNPELGFIRTANMHHFAYADANKNVPHLWMGGASANQKANHIRISIPDNPQREFDDQLRAMNRSRVIANLFLPPRRAHLPNPYPTSQTRTR